MFYWSGIVGLVFILCYRRQIFIKGGGAHLKTFTLGGAHSRGRSFEGRRSFEEYGNTIKLTYAIKVLFDNS